MLLLLLPLVVLLVMLPAAVQAGVLPAVHQLQHPPRQALPPLLARFAAPQRAHGACCLASAA
jgi:hypothetical protein